MRILMQCMIITYLVHMITTANPYEIQIQYRIGGIV